MDAQTSTKPSVKWRNTNIERPRFIGDSDGVETDMPIDSTDDKDDDGEDEAGKGNNDDLDPEDGEDSLIDISYDFL